MNDINLTLATGVLDDYLTWEFSRKTVQEAMGFSPIPKIQIFCSIALARELITGFSTEVKMKMFELFSPFSQRGRLFKEKMWSLEDYPVSNLGTVLPYAGDLPLEEIVKSFVEVADYVRRSAETGSSSRSIQYICSLSRITDVLDSLPVIVVEPGRQQRRPDVIETRGGQNLSVFQAEGYIEDGNHRALALMLSSPSRYSIRCWVGR